MMVHRPISPAIAVSTVLSLAVVACNARSSIFTPSQQPAQHNRLEMRAASSSSCPCLYVANNLNNSVTVYPATAHGNAAPIQTISGSNTQLDYPSGIAVDKSGNIYVTNGSYNPTQTDAVTVFAAGANGNVPPMRMIAGSNTDLDLPIGVAADSSGRIYVANQESSTVVVYAAGATGNVAPIATISGASTDLQGPTGLALDKKFIYVANNYDHSYSFLTVYRSNANGNVAPVRTIYTSGSASYSGLYNTGGVAVGGREVYAVNNTPPFTHVLPSVKGYPSHANGDVAPTRTIIGKKTKLETPSSLALDATYNIYVSNGVEVTVFSPGRATHPRPARILEGAKTGLDDPSGVAVH
jgi:hypothetical protein